MKRSCFLIVLILSLLVLTGFREKEKESNELYGENIIVNPDYEEYEKLSDEEKKGLNIIPKKYLNIYKEEKEFNVFNYEVIPTSYDLTNINGKRYTPTLKNQGDYGLCWTFSANTALESHLLIKNVGSYDFSERQIDYATVPVLQAISDFNYNPYASDNAYVYTRNLTEGGNNSIVSYLWASGVSPFFEEDFIEYNTGGKQTLYDVLSTKKMSFDVTGTIEFDSINIANLKVQKSFDEIKSIIYEYNKDLKKHIMENGALSTAVYYYFYDSATDLLYNDLSVSYSKYKKTGHAVTIIGWDDNYGDANNDGTPDGAWLVQNSWGDNNSYFYVSYFDKDVLLNTMGILSIDSKTWDNNYDYLNSKYSLNIDDDQFSSDIDLDGYNNNTWIFNKDESSEELKYIKLYNKISYSNNEIDIYISETGKREDLKFLKSQYIDHIGIHKIDIGNINLNNDTFMIYIDGKLGDNPELSVFTKEKQLKLDFNPVPTTNILSEFEIMDYIYIFSDDINTGSSYNVKVFDENNNNITNGFNISQIKVINNIGYISFNSNLDIDKFRVEIAYGNVVKNVNYDVIKFRGSGTEENPFLISTPEELIVLGTRFSDTSIPYYYYKLENNIDLKLITTSNGIYFNNELGWINKRFSGSFDGDGYKIKNLNSKYGGLFGYIYDSEIKNVGLINFNINKLTEDEFYGGALVDLSENSYIHNISGENIAIKGENVGCLIGSLDNSEIENSYCKGDVIGKTNAGGITAYAYYDNTYNHDLIINNTYFVGTVAIKSISSTGALNTLTSPGGITGEIYYYVNDSYADNYEMIFTNNYYLSEAKNDGLKYMYPFGYFQYRSTTMDANYTEENNAEILEDYKYEQFYYNGFDFTNVWHINENSFPTLKIFNKNNVTNISINNSNIKIKDSKMHFFPDTLKSEDVKSSLRLNENLKFNIFYSDGSLKKDTNYIKSGDVLCIYNEVDDICYTLVVTGDVNSDGEIDLYDIIAIRKHILETEIITNQISIEASDYEDDEEIDVYDIIKIRKKILES